MTTAPPPGPRWSPRERRARRPVRPRRRAGSPAPRPRRRGSPTCAGRAAALGHRHVGAVHVAVQAGARRRAGADLPAGVTNRHDAGVALVAPRAAAPPRRCATTRRSLARYRHDARPAPRPAWRRPTRRRPEPSALADGGADSEARWLRRPDVAAGAPRPPAVGGSAVRVLGDATATPAIAGSATGLRRRAAVMSRTGDRRRCRAQRAGRSTAAGCRRRTTSIGARGARPGGRSDRGRRTVDGTPVELGGQWIGPTQNRMYELVEELGLETFPTYNEGEHVIRLGGKRTRMGSQRGAIPKINPFALADLFQGLARFEQAGAADPARRAVDGSRRRPARRPDVRDLDPPQPAHRRRPGVLPHRHARRCSPPSRPTSPRCTPRSTPTRARTSRPCSRSTGARSRTASSAARVRISRDAWPPSSATGCGRRQPVRTIEHGDAGVRVTHPRRRDVDGGRV